MKTARQASQALTEKIRKLLMSELEKGGFEGAVRVCSEEAQRLTLEPAREKGVRIRRVSLRPRNPAAVPDELERRLLEEMDAAEGDGVLQPEYYRFEDSDDSARLRYLSPLVTAPLCVTCHGSPERIPEEVQVVISDRYPEDQATGYEPGQVRGAVSVSLPVLAETMP